MADGSFVTGQFQGGEINGMGLKKWPENDGRVYKGCFLEGEMHGEGSIDYGRTSERSGDKTYVGQFHLNSREGQGVLTKTNGNVYKGNF
jgi:hypothetical protein